MSLWTRLRNALFPAAINRELDEEMRLHVEEAVARGRSEEEARRSFGPLLAMRERSRDAKVWVRLETILTDSRFAWRHLKKNWIASSAAVLSLGLAIGACTASFRLVDALLFRPLPVVTPQKLFVATFTATDQAGNTQEVDSFSYPLLREMREALVNDAALMAISYTSRIDVTFGGDEEMEKVHRQYVSGNTFPTFGLRPALGRLIGLSDDVKPGGHPVAVLSHAYWSRRFGLDPNIIGRRFRAGDVSYEIIGVAPEGFTGTDTGAITGIFVPTMMNRDAIGDAGWGWFRLWVRAADHQSLENVRDRLQAVFTSHRRERAKAWPADTPRDRVEKYLKTRLSLAGASTGASSTRRNFGRPLLIISALAALILLIACANVANLLIAQSVERAREMALRLSIGAGRARLVQAVMVESGMLSLAATVCGTLFSWWAAPWVIASAGTAENPVMLNLPADGRMIAFTAALSIAVTLLFGLVPALRACGVDPLRLIRGGDDPVSKRRLGQALVTAQIAICFLIHFAGGLFVTTFDHLASQPLGFEAKGVLQFETTVKGRKKLSQEQWLQVADDLGQLPGVESVALCSWPLMSGNGWSENVVIPGQPVDTLEPYFLEVSPGFLATMKITLLAGRDFTRQDTRLSSAHGEAPQLAIVNEAFARRFFEGVNPVGRVFSIQRKDKPPRVEVVGYMRDVRYLNMRDKMHPVAFLPIKQPKDWATFTVQTTSDPLALAGAMRQEITSRQPAFRVVNTHTQLELVRKWTVRERLLASLSVFFSGLALLLAGIGLYGLLSHSVLRRRREIGIRMAIGARPSQIAGDVSRQVIGMLVCGSVLGLGAGLLSSRFLSTLLYGVEPTGFASMAIPLAILSGTALLAAIPPALSAVRVDPAETLRSA